MICWQIMLIAATTLLGGAPARSFGSAGADSTRDALREEDFLRGIATLGLTRAFTDLEASEPSASAADTATPALRAIALSRMTLMSPATPYLQRLAALEQLRRVRSELCAARPADPRRVLWFSDTAEDELVLGFLALDGGAEAIAGSADHTHEHRADASLDRVAAALQLASAAAQALDGSAVPVGSLLSQRLDDDAHATRPFLEIAVAALRLAIDRSTHDPVIEAERQSQATALLQKIDQLREAIPTRLRPEADLVEVAAAAVAVRTAEAQFAAARAVVRNDLILTVLSRILVADCLIREHKGSAALHQLSALWAANGLPTAIRLLVADAFVRTSVFLGRSPSEELVLNAWIAVVLSASPIELAGVRRAVLERIACALRGQAIYGSPPPLAAIALARDRLLTDPQNLEALAALRQFADQAADMHAQAAAIVVLSEIHAAAGDWGRAADDYRQFARCVPHESTSINAMDAALSIELALDAANPDQRLDALEATLELACNRYAELPSRSRSAAQLESLRVRRRVEAVLAAADGASQDDSKSFTQSAARIEEMSAIATRAGFDPGSRVTAALQQARIAADLLNTGSAPFLLATAPPTRDAWKEWTSHDAQTILRLRLQRAALAAAPALAFDAELRDLPAALVSGSRSIARESLLRFMQRQVEVATALEAAGDPAAITTASAALDAVVVWEQLHPAVTSDSPRAVDALDRLAADAAAGAHAWVSAAERAQTVARASNATLHDYCRLAQTLAAAQRAAAEAADLPRRDALRVGAMAAARDLATRAKQGTREWWIGQAIQLEIAQATGRGGEPLQAKIARLRSFDSTLGGEPFRSTIEGLARAAEGESN